MTTHAHIPQTVTRRRMTRCLPLYGCAPGCGCQASHGSRKSSVDAAGTASPSIYEPITANCWGGLEEGRDVW